MARRGASVASLGGVPFDYVVACDCLYAEAGVAPLVYLSMLFVYRFIAIFIARCVDASHLLVAFKVFVLSLDSYFACLVRDFFS